MTIPDQKSGKPFHGWKILALATFSQFVSVGFTVYLIGLYIDPLSRTFSATPGQLGWASAIFMLVASGVGPVLGHWVDKGKVRLLMTLGAVLLAAGFILLSVTESLWQAALCCVLFIAPGSALLGVVTAGAMLVQWFERRRGLAVGIAAAGISAGGFSMPPIAAWLFVNYGWRTGSLAMGVFIALVLVPLVWLVAVSKPAVVGQHPDGDREPSQTTGAGGGQAAQTYRELLARRDFWFMTLSIGAINFSSIMIITYLIPFARERGIDPQLSAFMLSAYAGAAFFGKFIAGWLCDRFSARRLLTGIALSMALGLLPMLLLDWWLFFPVSAAVVGFALGGLMPAWASLIAVNFGPQAFGRVKGGMSFILTSVAIIPGPLGGYLYDLNGSYEIAFDVLFWVLISGSLISLLIPGKPSIAAPVSQLRSAD